MSLETTSKSSALLPSFIRVGLKIDDERTVFVKLSAFTAMSGWILVGYSLFTGTWWTDLYALSGLLPFLFDILFTYTHSDMFYFDFCWENYAIFFFLLVYNSLILLPLFWLDTSPFYILSNFVGSMVININCSLTMLRVHNRCHKYLEYFKITKLPVGELQSGIANRDINEQDLTYAISNIKKNLPIIRRTIDYLKYRMMFTAPFFACNILIAVKTNYYSGYIAYLSNFVPISTPFLFLSLIVMTHNAQIWAWEEFNLVDSGCCIVIFGVRIRHAWFISLASFVLVAFLKVFVVK